MIDLDEALRADAARWNATRPALGLDERVRKATTTHRSRAWIYPGLAAAAVLVLVAVLTWTGVFSRRSHDARPAEQELSRITGVVWVDPSVTFTSVVFHETTMRIQTPCSTLLSTLIHDANHVARGRVLYASSCSGHPGPPSASDREADRFYNIVKGPATWHRTGNTLVLTTPKVGSVTLTTNGRPAPELTKTRWVLVSYVDADGYSHSYTGPPRVEFQTYGTDSYVSGDGCISFPGHETHTDTTVTLRPIAHFLPGCVQVDMHVVDTLERLLDGQLRYFISGDRMVLSNRFGEAIYQAAH